MKPTPRLPRHRHTLLTIFERTITAKASGHALAAHGNTPTATASISTSKQPRLTDASPSGLPRRRRHKTFGAGFTARPFPAARDCENFNSPLQELTPRNFHRLAAAPPMLTCELLIATAPFRSRLMPDLPRTIFSSGTQPASPLRSGAQNSQESADMLACHA